MKTLTRTFSRNFLASHPNAGQPTFFVEKIWKWYYDQHNGDVRDLLWYNEQYDNEFGEEANFNVHQFEPKFNTIRSGHHFAAGDYLRPKVWRGVPYRSKQLQFMPDLEIKAVYDLKITIEDKCVCGYVNGNLFYYQFESGKEWGGVILKFIAQNDGLDTQKFKDWFKWGQPFDGQIICWKDVYKNVFV